MSEDIEWSEDAKEIKQAFLLQLINQAQVHLLGSSKAGIKAELFDTFREFFNDSSCWLEDITFVVVPTSTSYELSPSGGRIIRLAGVVDSNKTPQSALMPTIGTITFSNSYSSVQMMVATVVKNVDHPFKHRGVP